ncbi:MAG: MIP/aquaporin family protein [Methanobacteriota archaeon]
MTGLPGRVTAEAVATFALTFIGAGAILTNELTGGDVGLLGIALAHGIILAVMVTATMHISGGHVNPAVTIGAMATKKIDAATGGAYIAAQLAGASLAGFLLASLFDADVADAVRLGTPGVNADLGVTPVFAAFIEIVLTFFLVFVVFGTGVDARGAGLKGLAIGLTIAADILMGGPLTGAAMNPARWFGTAVAGGGFADAWVYVVGPVAGGVLAAFVYDSLYLKRP